MILALNMFDELEVSEKANFERLGGMLGFPVMPTVARKGSGIKDIIQVIIDFARAAEPGQRKVNIRLTREVEEGIASLEGKISGLMRA
jgi:ferrous iron transport protein B